MFGLFKRKGPEYGGYIAALGLVDFWRSLSEDDRQFIRNVYASGEEQTTDRRYIRAIDDPKNSMRYVGRHPSNFLTGYATWAINAKRYTLADRMLTEALRLNPPIIERHFTLNTAIDLTYKMREIDPTALNRCIAYCHEDITLYPQFEKAWRKEYPSDNGMPRIPSFQRLVIILEKLERYGDAITVCELALKYGLHDNTKGGFAGRIEKLQKKL